MSEASLVIRNAQPEEFEAVGDVIRAAYAEYLPNAPDERQVRYLDRTADVWSRSKEADLLVALLDGRIVGTVTLFPNRAGESVQGWPEGWTGIRVLGVLPEARGRGIGRALIEESIRRSRDMGAVAVGLHTTEMMAIARAMYERMGFVAIPEYDFRPSSGLVVFAYRYDL